MQSQQTVSLDNYRIFDRNNEHKASTAVLNSPRSLIACKRVNIDPKQLINERIDENIRKEQFAFVKEEFANIQQNGITQEEFQQMGAPISCANYVNSKAASNNSALIERIMEKQQHELNAANERFHRLIEYEQDQERKRAEQERVEEQRDQRRKEEIEEYELQLSQRLKAKQEKNRREQEQAALVVEQNHANMVRKITEDAKRRDELLARQRTEQEQRLQERTQHHGDKMAKSQAYFSRLTQTKNERNQLSEERTQARLERQQKLLQEEMGQRRERTENRLNTIRQNVQRLYEAERQSSLDFLNQLNRQLDSKQRFYDELKQETAQKFRAKGEEAASRAAKMWEQYDENQRQKESRLMEKFRRESRNMERAARHERVQQSVSRNKQRIVNQQDRFREIVELQSYNQQIKDNINKIKADRNDRFVEEREHLKQMMSELATRHEAEKEQAEFEKYYGPNSWQWKRGLVSDAAPAQCSQSRAASPTRTASPTRRTASPSRGPSRFMLQKEGISELNQMIEKEDKRELEREQELKTAKTEEQRREIMEKHKKERIETAKHLNELRVELSREIAEI